MTIAPQRSGPGVQPTHPARLQHSPQNTCSANDSTTNLDRYPADQVGYLCLGTISGNPDDKLPLEQHWYTWPAERDRARRDLETWANRGLNTYVVPCLFTQRERTYDTALPSAWLWLDDVALNGAELVESSEGNYQSWIPLDRPITARERQHLQAAIRDQHPGADACSKDAIHFARAVGGWNTKRTPWQVQLVRPALRVVSVAALFARYGQPSDIVATKPTTLSWQYLPNSMQLAQSARFLRLRANNEQLERVCTGLPVALMMKNGRLDDSLSNARAVFVYQLIRAKYPLEEAQSLYNHFADVLGKAQDFYSDFERLWQHYQPATYRPEPTRSLQPATTVVAPVGGRHYEITAAELLDYYASIADSRPTGTRADVTLIATADALGVSVSTIRRREAELIAAGQIRRCVTDDRQSSYVLIGATYVCSQPMATPDRPDCAPVAPPIVADTATYVCSQSDTPLADAEYVPVEAVCEECAHVEITYTTGNPTAAPQHRSAPDSSPGSAAVVWEYVLSTCADEPQTFQFADDLPPAPAGAPVTDDPQAASYDPTFAVERPDRAPYWRAPDGEKVYYLREPDWQLRPDAAIVPEADAGDMFDCIPRSPHDTYREKIGQMDLATLREERKKHKRTLRNHKGAPWLSSIKRKLRAIEAELLVRGDTQPTNAGARSAATHRRARDQALVRERQLGMSLTGSAGWWIASTLASA